MHYSCAMDLIDREILHLLQEDSTRSARELGAEGGLTPTPCWRRVQNLRREGIIQREVAILDPERLSLGINALVQIRTNDHSATWLADFTAAIEEFPEIVEAFRTSGRITQDRITKSNKRFGGLGILGKGTKSS